eukprot:TRINITY_DN13210_c0_g1_i2.p1 TRINITY_DN13210_c0_g1~~TRINITY_DN13210_c0_g1_i2.p1  ORF type:complete len:450 (-),score=42.13 TRINITY_DN13210_c0_g1_i2:161-1390(-)
MSHGHTFQTDWNTMYSEVYRDGFGPHCERAVPTLSRVAQTGPKEIDIAMAPGGVFEEKLDGHGTHATTNRLTYVGPQAAASNKASSSGQQPIAGLVGRAAATTGWFPEATHSRCIQHEDAEQWRVNCLNTSANRGQCDSDQIKRSLRSWVRGRTLTPQEREQSWRKWQRKELRAAAAARQARRQGGAAPQGFVKNDVESVSGVTVSVMPAGLKSLESRKAEIEDACYNVVTWKTDRPRKLPGHNVAVAPNAQLPDSGKFDAVGLQRKLADGFSDVPERGGGEADALTFRAKLDRVEHGRQTPLPVYSARSCTPSRGFAQTAFGPEDTDRDGGLVDFSAEASGGSGIRPKVRVKSAATTAVSAPLQQLQDAFTGFGVSLGAIGQSKRPSSRVGAVRYRPHRQPLQAYAVA